MKALLTMVIISLAVCSQESLHAQPKVQELIVGTYTGQGSEGIYIYTFNEEDATFSARQTISGVENPSFLTLGRGSTLYAVNELGEGRGSVSAFTYGAEGSQLLSEMPSKGDAPCYIVADKENKFIFVSNYSGGSLAVYRTDDDGNLEQMVQHIQYQGSGPNRDRQEAPHVHSSVFSPDERFLLVQDLGTDRINIYPFSTDKEQPLEEEEVRVVSTPSGRGPRHVTFSPDGRFVYAIAELTSSVLVYSFDNGEMALLEEISLLPEVPGPSEGAADIHFSPDGKFLYASNRGTANELTIFEVDQTTGRLKETGKQAVFGEGPRNFAITPHGKFLLVANQKTNEVVIFERNSQTGQLKDTGKRIAISQPVCLVFN
jgi:6-phosphogluconolactonase